MAHQIGESLKRLRREQKKTLKQIAEKTGLSISFLSQVERLKSSVTIESLTKIAESLNVSPTYFFSDNDHPRSVIRRKTPNDQVDFQQSRFSYQSLAGDIPNPDFEPMIVTVLPNQEQVHTFTHNGQEFIYVLSGVLTVMYEKEEVDLTPGDSFHVESSKPHNWYNRTDDVVKMVYVRSHSFE